MNDMKQLLSSNSSTSPSRHLLVSDFCQRRRRRQGGTTRRHSSSSRKNNQNHDQKKKCTPNTQVIINTTTVESNTASNVEDIPSCINNDNHNHDGSCRRRTFENYHNDDDDNRPQVYVEIVHSIPRIKSTASSNSNNTTSSSSSCSSQDDDFATVYTKDIELLHELQIFNGQICFLNHCYYYNNHDDNCSNIMIHNHHQYYSYFLKTPIILKMLPNTDSPVSTQTLLQGNNRSNKNNDNHKPMYHVYVPPTLAASIGIYSTMHHDLKQNSHKVFISSSLSSSPSIIENPTRSYNSYNIPIATKVDIIEIGKCPNDFITTFETICNPKLIDKREELNDEAIKQYFLDFTTNTNMHCNQNNGIGKYRLVGHGSIFGTCPNYSDKNDYDRDDVMRFYKVIYLECDSDKNVYYSNRRTLQDRIYWISPNTKLTLIHSIDDDRNNNHYLKSSDYMKDKFNFKRLPQRSVAKEFFQSVRFSRISQHYNKHHFSEEGFDIENLTSTNCRDSSVALDTLMQKIMMVVGDLTCNYYGSKIALESRMLHVTCRRKMELEHSLNVVADKLGMNILHVDGLAAFLFRQRLYSNIKSEKSKIVTGAIHDKLAGIEVAFDVALKASPCLLHINLENELFEHDDQEMCDDQENRLLSTIKQQLLLHCSSQVQLLHDDVPSIFLIISTKEQLRNGPLRQSLVHSSITMKSSMESDPIGKGKKVSKTVSLIPDVRWEDVGGLFHIREEIIDAIELPLKHPQLFGKSKRSGILLYGPPGTGKTLIAKAIATECNLPFISVKGPELLGSYVGESESNIRETFESARNAALNGKGAILFFDEIDSLAPRRGGVGDGGGVMERVVATFLGEMDKELGPSTSNIDKVNTGLLFVVAATNRPDLLDPSLLRPGRFDRLVYLGVTTQRKDRVSILTSLIRKFTFEGCIEASTMAEQVIDSLPESLSGAEFSAVCNGALMLAVKRLCFKADQELSKNVDAHDKRIKHVGEIITNWNKEQRTPKVTPSDFVLAAEKIVPMASEEDLKTFEDLRLKFQT